MNMGTDELVFVPLGGLGEIGMNLALYGFGPKQNRRWIMVDCGIGFAGPEQMGIDLIIPDPQFVEKIRPNLLGLIITHAHEDHIGAVADLWGSFKCKLFATPFAAGLLKLKRLAEPGAPEVAIDIVLQGARIAAYWRLEDRCRSRARQNHRFDAPEGYRRRRCIGPGLRFHQYLARRRQPIRSGCCKDLARDHHGVERPGRRIDFCLQRLSHAGCWARCHGRAARCCPRWTLNG